MNIEIHQPELEQRVRDGLQSGRFRDADELLTRALDALSESPESRTGALDWSQCPAVESVPSRLGGAWVFRDTRLPVSTVFSNLEDGATVDEITEWFRISKDRVLAVLEFAARSVAAPRAIAYQQNLKDRKIAIVILSGNSWRLVQRVIRKIVVAVDKAEPGSYALIEVPPR